MVLKTLKLDNVTLDSSCKACKKTNTKVVERRRWKLKKLGRRLFPRTRRKYKDKTISVPLSSRLCPFGNNKRL